MTRLVLMLILMYAYVGGAGCAREMQNPDWATRVYPREMHTTNVLGIQVFREGEEIEIVNSTANSFTDFDIWINQRYVTHVDAMRAGETVRVSLWDFHDHYGDKFNAGGFFREYEPTPVRLVQIQPSESDPMVGLITIRAEEVKVKPEQRR